MLDLFWHPNFHPKNIVMAIFTRIFYKSYIQSGGSWHRLEIPWCQLNWNIKYNLANSAALPIPPVLEEKLYIVVQFKVRDN